VGCVIAVVGAGGGVETIAAAVARKFGSAVIVARMDSAVGAICVLIASRVGAI
jgi:hypothetical protein